MEGFELGLTGRLMDGWTILTAYSHLDSEFTASANPLEQGAALAFVPESSFNVWTEGHLPRGLGEAIEGQCGSVRGVAEGPGLHEMARRAIR